MSRSLFTLEQEAIKEKMLRITIVNQQAKIEEEISQNSHKAAAVFVVSTPLTPLYIPDEPIFFDKTDGLYKISQLDLIPQGLIPREKLLDAEQLSTVLRRVKTLHNMLERKMPILVLYQTQREKVSQESELQSFVDDTILQRNLSVYPSLKIIPIDVIPEGIHTANYCYESGQVASITASQIQQPESVKWSVNAEENGSYVAQLNGLLVGYGMSSIDMLIQTCPSIIVMQPK